MLCSLKKQGSTELNSVRLQGNFRAQGSRVVLINRVVETALLHRKTKALAEQNIQTTP